MKDNVKFNIRYANKDDAALILEFIKKLAVYEKMENEVTATTKKIEESIFDNKDAEVIIAEEHHQPIGFALFFKTYSTFLGKANYYLEDLYINEDKRGLGYGKQMLSFLANITYKRNANRLEWVCLDWNKPSIKFYKKLGAIPLEDWTTYRLSGNALKSLADHQKS